MTKESMENLVKRVVKEICEKNKRLDPTSPFSIAVYDPQKSRSEGLIKTCTSLKSAVYDLYTLLEKEPAYTGEIFFYRRDRIVVYTRSPHQ